MPDWIVSSLPGLASVLIVGGGLFVKVNRLERDVSQCVTREILTLHMDGIKAEIGRLADRLPPREHTDPGARR